MHSHAVDLTLELLSPCFLGGAQQEPEFRIASLRGMWRYWYRALYGRGDETAPGQEERALFGGIAASGAGGGAAASARLIAVGGEDVTAAELPWSNPRVGPDQVDGRGYLLFSMGMNRRSYLPPGARLALRLVIDERRVARRPGCAPAMAVERARTSLAAACAFSGLGARSRRLAGAVALRLVTPEPSPPLLQESPKDADALAQYLRGLVQPSATRSAGPGARGPEYHVISAGTFRAGVLRKTFATWEDAAREVGANLAAFRRRRQPDSDIARALATGGQPPPGTITRAAFGLPITFRFRSGGRPVHATPGRDREARRGSPLFLTLERLADGRLAVVWCRFRSRLTAAPDGGIYVDGRSMPAPDLSLIDEMLARPEWASHAVVG